MDPTTNTIDALFLELSQFTRATTAKEAALQARITGLRAALGQVAWDLGSCNPHAANARKALDTDAAMAKATDTLNP